MHNNKPRAAQDRPRWKETSWSSRVIRAACPLRYLAGRILCCLCSLDGFRSLEIAERLIDAAIFDSFDPDVNDHENI